MRHGSPPPLEGGGRRPAPRGVGLASQSMSPPRRFAPTLPFQGRVLRILDIGTGTGVLAIAAAKSLRCPVFASDIDPEAVAIARTNARLNGVSPLVECICAKG